MDITAAIGISEGLEADEGNETSGLIIQTSVTVQPPKHRLIAAASPNAQAVRRSPCDTVAIVHHE